MLDQEFDRILKICRIKLTEQERLSIKKDIDEVITYFNSIKEVETGNAEPAYHPIKIKEKTRDDTVDDFGNSDSILKNTKTYRFYVVGPKV